MYQRENAALLNVKVEVIFLAWDVTAPTVEFNILQVLEGGDGRATDNWKINVVNLYSLHAADEPLID